MRTIPLTQGFVALVDDADFLGVSRFKWFADVKPKTVYAIRAVRKDDGTKTSQYLHRLIMGVTDPKVQIDHEDHNGLNCQRYNLRPATNQQNTHNARSHGGTSAYKGVTWDRAKGKWRARFSVEGKRRSLGYFDSEVDAALVYDTAAREHYGNFAYTNFSPKMACENRSPALVSDHGMSAA
jgi:AP2 domain